MYFSANVTVLTRLEFSRGAEGEIHGQPPREPSFNNWPYAACDWTNSRICYMQYMTNCQAYCVPPARVLPQFPWRRPRRRWICVLEHPGNCTDPFLVKKSSMAPQSIFKEM